ncbi:uncharacterized protein LOC134546321 isoform X1 [Bacillus rossius redtenbacheri]|uniref:uncharacterized protein LOC134546321 isoform X1 n=1 Tax=Bacillus rossius redtenbacheri TaxID=93214 RepID=UPI002FDDD369
MPIVVYCDFEAILEKIHACHPNPDESYMLQYQKHKAYSYCIYVKADNTVIPSHITSALPSQPEVYRGCDAEDKFISRIVEIGHDVQKIFSTSVTMTPLTHAQNTAFLQARCCCYCGGRFGGAVKKVRDHNHFTGEFIGPACNDCNLLRRRPKKIIVFFHNLAYNQNFIIRKLGYDSKDIFIIPNSEEKLITFSKKLHDKFSIQFVDTFRFMSRGLASLAEFLPANKFISTAEFFAPDELGLVTRKGVFPYDFVDSFALLDDSCLPPIDDFYNMLTDSGISEADYAHAQNVWDKFQCATLGEYADLYLKTDVLILADVFENFRSLCLETYSLDPSHYIYCPGFAFDAMVRTTGVQLELLTDYDMYMIVEAGIRGGVAQSIKPHCVANNAYIPETHVASKPSTFLEYIDGNNLYGWAMSLPLPIRHFQWTDTSIDVMSIPENSPTGYIIECDVEYPL